MSAARGFPLDFSKLDKDFRRIPPQPAQPVAIEKPVCKTVQPVAQPVAKTARIVAVADGGKMVPVDVSGKKKLYLFPNTFKIGTDSDFKDWIRKSGEVI